MRTILLVAAMSASLSSFAQATLQPPQRIAGFASVAAALAELEARDGKDTIVTHPDGWTIVNEPQASAQWSFVPAGHFAYPAVVRRIIRRSGAASPVIETGSLCEAPQAECERLLAEFATMDDRILQTVRGRSRQGSSRQVQ